MGPIVSAVQPVGVDGLDVDKATCVTRKGGHPLAIAKGDEKQQRDECERVAMVMVLARSRERSVVLSGSLVATAVSG